MRTLVPLALLSAVALAACSTDTPTSPRSAATRARAPRPSFAAVGAIASRPISGRCRLTVLATDPYPAPPLFRQVAAGTCELAGLGRAAVHFVQVVDLAAHTQHSLELTYTAANGDVLRANSAGTSAPGGAGLLFSATIDFVGGTGRFADATGEAHAEGTADLNAGSSWYRLDGRIAYRAAGSSGS